MNRLRRIVRLRNLAFVPMVALLLDLGPCFRGDQQCRLVIGNLVFFFDSSLCNGNGNGGGGA